MAKPEVDRKVFDAAHGLREEPAPQEPKGAPRPLPEEGRELLARWKGGHHAYVWGVAGDPETFTGCRCGAASWPCATREARLIEAVEIALTGLACDGNCWTGGAAWYETVDGKRHEPDCGEVTHSRALAKLVEVSE